MDHIVKPSCIAALAGRARLIAGREEKKKKNKRALQPT